MAEGRDGAPDRQEIPAGKWARARWSKAMRVAFLDHLAATCNVIESAAAAGVTPSAVYQIRRRDPRFAARWEEALALGYQMLETRMVGHVLSGQRWGDPLATGDGALAAIDFEAGLRLLTQHRNGPVKPHKGRQAGYANRDDTDAMLLKRLRAIEARRVRDAGWATAVEAGKAELLTHDADADAPAAARDAVIEQAPGRKVAGNGA